MQQPPPVPPAAQPAVVPQTGGAVGTPSEISQGIVPVPTPTVVPAPQQPVEDSVARFQGVADATGLQMQMARETVDSLNVEIQKKFALSFACFVFVLFGPPIALRFPRGGVGVTLGVSIVVFGLYYICLMGGETLADKGRLPPPVAMWIANVVFTLVGVLLLLRVERTTDASRGGGIRDWWADRKMRRSLRTAAVRPAEMSA